MSRFSRVVQIKTFQEASVWIMQETADTLKLRLQVLVVVTVVSVAREVIVVTGMEACSLSFLSSEAKFSMCNREDQGL